MEVIPPFPVKPDDSAEADVPAAPKGINPDTALASLPSSNPFRPLRLDPATTPARAALVLAARRPLRLPPLRRTVLRSLLAAWRLIRLPQPVVRQARAAAMQRAARSAPAR
ncbi:hypothetical protein ACFSC4_08485 [Deinococcus malanensis]|uniref:hypothetical protein n=1 Tax=Deinococcus malanensis TaxID=1706855 RepID=UPI003639BBFF